jgi:hypothetical protein
MPLLPYALARPFLFGLDPEAAHELTLKSLATAQNTPLQWAWCAGMVDDPVTVAGIRFPNRVGLAAGLDKNAHCIDGLGAMGFGFVEVGTVTPKGQPGNPKPRMFRLPQSQGSDQPPGLQQRRAGCVFAQRAASQMPPPRFAKRHATGPEHRQKRRHAH